MKVKFNHNIGYACQNLDVEMGVYKTARINRFNDEVARELIAHNLSVLEGMIDYNIENNIKMFRVTSSLIPFASNKEVMSLDWQTTFQAELAHIARKILDNNIRISLHPGQYTVLNSLSEEVVERSILELEYHVDIIESLGGDQTSKMIIHIGGVFGDKELSIARFIEVVNTRLSERIRRHLILENDDRLYNAEEVNHIAKMTRLPMVFDNLHNECNPCPGRLDERTLILQAFSTWKKTDGRPKIHYSQQDIGKRIGAHTYTINAEKFNEFFKPLADLSFDIMLEVKDKNRSAVKIITYINNDHKAAEKEWSRYKYLVLGKSENAYKQIREILKDKTNFSAREFYKVIDDALTLDENMMREVNALEHVGGYFKKTATEWEKEVFRTALKAYKEQKTTLNKLKLILKKLAIKYHEHYLLNSYYFNHQDI
ncbi:MAG TPA: UV DNA damage repair endonuclease UvsE [Bacilli bacterium]|nr:UV DNA damage repair endonuclease UvsE [Bacilli bacterium]